MELWSAALNLGLWSVHNKPCWLLSELYPIFKVPASDAQNRQSMLAKVRSCSKSMASGLRTFNEEVFLVMPYSPSVKHLKIQSSFRKHLSRISIDATLLDLWTPTPGACSTG